MPKKRPKRRRSVPGKYDVGWGRPPLSTRWQAGQSGNPKGRPKGRKNLATIFNEVLNQKLEIQEKGRTRQISAREGIVRRVVSEALKGNLKATAFVLAKEPEIARAVVPEPKITADMSAQEASDIYMRLIRGDD